MRLRAGFSALFAVALAGIAALLPAPARAAETVRVGGTGFVIALMRLLGDRVAQARPDIETDVLSSLGSWGGLAALLEGAVELAVTAQPLSAAERAKGLREAACATTPLTFATSRSESSNVALRDLPALFADPNPRWPDGTPLKVVLRSRTGAEVPYLSTQLPGMGDALAAAFKRPGIAIGATDQENADLAQRIVGSVAIITLLQIRTEQLALQPLSLDGVAPTTEAITAATWPLPIRFCLVVPTAPMPGARHLVTYFTSPDGQALLVRSGALPANQ
jgi:phosphate transport system substrate-binding protein